MAEVDFDDLAQLEAFGRSEGGLEAAGVRVLDQPFYAHGNVASAGGCLAATYLVSWSLWRLFERQVARRCT
jgi:peptidoglycan/LPS O-acetylase OafA/YrhL